jgi:hypothetical protein
MHSNITIFLLIILVPSTIHETWNYHDLGPDVWIFIFIGEKIINPAVNIKCKFSIILNSFFCILFRNGKKYAGEIHFVYLNPDTRQTAVLGIFINSQPNITLSEDLTVEEWRKCLEEAGK